MILRIIVFAALIALGSWMAYTQLMKGRRCSQPATASIVGRERKRTHSARGRSSAHYAPVVEFDAFGQTIRATADVDSVFAGKYKDGDTLEIRFNPQKPEEFVVQGKSFRSGVLGGGFLVLIGILGLILSLKK